MDLDVFELKNSLPSTLDETLDFLPEELTLPDISVIVPAYLEEKNHW